MTYTVTLLLVAGGSLVFGALVMFIGVVVGSRITFRAAGGDGGVLLDKSQPEIVSEDDEDEEPEIEIE